MTGILDARLAAVANPTRRAILQLTARRERSAGELAHAFSVTRPAVSQHIRVLVNAGLLIERRERQRRLYHADAAAVKAFREQFDQFWAIGLHRLKTAVESDVAARAGSRRSRRGATPQRKRRD
jgi:DNA-binding transcriptional ArsR family regulator